jgi:hypothetical protein
MIVGAEADAVKRERSRFEIVCANCGSLSERSPLQRCALECRTMDKSDAGFDHDRYRKLLAEATDESKRLALINLLIEERAKDRLSEQALHEQLTRLGLSPKPKSD